MVRQCAWCKVIMGRVLTTEEGGVTHGICPVCSARLLAQVGRSLPGPGELKGAAGGPGAANNAGGD